MHPRDDGFTRELSADLELIETNERIVQEVSCAADWSEVADILHRHRKHYYWAPAPRTRAPQRTDQRPHARTNIEIAGITRAPAC
jgi:hypothetical protein